MLAVLEGFGRADLGSIFAYVFASNIFLGVFNLLPAFPMDGGRVLRALLASSMPYGRATGIAVFVGRSLAWLMGLWGFLSGGFLLVLIAVFIYVGAGQEGQLVQVRSVLAGLTVGQAYSRNLRALSPRSTLREAIDLTLSTVQTDFPVCEGDQLTGILPQTTLVEALHRYGPDVPVGQVMQTGVASVAPGDPLFRVQQRLAEHRWEAVPVVEGGRFLGLITTRDISEVYRLVSSRPELLRGTNPS
jgi:stage IV sporulation protein FB